MALLRGGDALPRAYYDAICALAEEVDEACFQGNQDRREWRVKQKRPGQDEWATVT